jgi:hypothetical protein
MQPSGAPETAAMRPATVASAPAGAPSDLDAIESDSAWALVRSVADDATGDEAANAGLGARPGLAERAMIELTVEERQELFDLLEAETETRTPGA